VTRLLTLVDEERAGLVSEVVSACQGLPGAPYELVGNLADRYPGDVGAVIALLLNPVRLKPGEVIFLAAGVPHAYLRGVGIELMASSDNVLRGGLTAKRVDVSELLRVVRFEPGPATPLPASHDAPGVCTWRPPVSEFALRRVVLDEDVSTVRLPAGGPGILFCLAGDFRADDGVGEAALRSGEAAFVPAGRSLTLAGAGVLFHATTA
jgi:mannose-6-phosphate isomerase